jgi:hypothetical protein
VFFCEYSPGKWNSFEKSLNAVEDGGCIGGEEEHVQPTDHFHQDSKSAQCSAGREFRSFQETVEPLDGGKCCVAAARHKVVDNVLQELAEWRSVLERKKDRTSDFLKISA